ncbi:hypothetical protein Goari_012766 [Gossypium aridum]|uniref:Uncharacterized protein n=1 Tax=Gossypium aridum TaxID=34290 RepID=A0A7J8X2T4_GOSAI|nr:hypothetical protein [Gossypium aridum]
MINWNLRSLLMEDSFKIVMGVDYWLQLIFGQLCSFGF